VNDSVLFGLALAGATAMRAAAATAAITRRDFTLPPSIERSVPR
jgi:hypothetical protein